MHFLTIGSFEMSRVEAFMQIIQFDIELEEVNIFECFFNHFALFKETKRHRCDHNFEVVFIECSLDCVDKELVVWHPHFFVNDEVVFSRN